MLTLSDGRVVESDLIEHAVIEDIFTAIIERAVIERMGHAAR